MNRPSVAQMLLIARSLKIHRVQEAYDDYLRFAEFHFCAEKLQEQIAELRQELCDLGLARWVSGELEIYGAGVRASLKKLAEAGAYDPKVDGIFADLSGTPTDGD